MSKKPTFRKNQYKKIEKVVILIIKSNKKIYRLILYNKIVNNLIHSYY